MSTRFTIFSARLVQDSALSVSGIDRESTSDQPFTMIMIDGQQVPILSGRGLKGAAVAMARRFFAPLPRSVSEEIGRTEALRRSAWLFRNAHPIGTAIPRLRSGVGILQQTGARAQRVLYDREVLPEGTEWQLDLRVDWQLAGPEAEEVEGILGYVLSKHWNEGRCWLGGGAARGLGWCHLEHLQTYRIRKDAYDDWVIGDRKLLTQYESETPSRDPNRSWYFRTIEVKLKFGEYRPEGANTAWGVDMLAVGPHEIEQGVQRQGTGTWARPSWVDDSSQLPDQQLTQRSILMDGEVPLIPGSSIRGPLRHAFSRDKRRQGRKIADPNHPDNHKKAQAEDHRDDEAERFFGTVKNSSSLLIRDARAEDDWTAARLHMHAEDEFSAGSYGSAKRDAVRLLSGTFSVRFVIEGGDLEAVDQKQQELNRLIALGQLGHLPIGGHKTKGAGFGQWTPEKWMEVNVVQSPNSSDSAPEANARQNGTKPSTMKSAGTKPQTGFLPLASIQKDTPQPRSVLVETGTLDEKVLRKEHHRTLAMVAQQAPKEVKDALVAWWCEPAIDFDVKDAPETFGWTWPTDEKLTKLKVEEVAFFAGNAVWRIARTNKIWRTVYIREVDNGTTDAVLVDIHPTPARLHQDRNRFSAKLTASGRLLVKEWRAGSQCVGYTLTKGSK